VDLCILLAVLPTRNKTNLCRSLLMLRKMTSLQLHRSSQYNISISVPPFQTSISSLTSLLIEPSAHAWLLLHAILLRCSSILLGNANILMSSSYQWNVLLSGMFFSGYRGWQNSLWHNRPYCYASRRLIFLSCVCFASIQGCQMGYFMANFKTFDHFLTALAMKKRISYFWSLFWFVNVKLSFH